MWAHLLTNSRTQVARRKVMPIKAEEEEEEEE
jgi:hypothetical protein